MKVALITNIPAPHRSFVYNRIAERLGDKFCVFYCALREPNRVWKIEDLNLKHQHRLLKQRMIKIGEDKYIHLNFDIWGYLTSFNPDVIVSAGFRPTMLLALVYARLYRKKYIPMSEGTLKSEAHLPKVHFLIRRMVYKHSDAFIAASKHAASMFEHCGVIRSKIFISSMCIDNERYEKFADIKKEYDIMFSGQFISRKMPFFFIEVAKKLSVYKKDLKVLLIGAGPLQNSMLRELDKNSINYNLPGFIKQNDLPRYYGSSKFLLFPTQYDSWGTVVNEASATGTVVITCDNAGVANDLIIDGVSGFVLPLNSDLWVEKILELLNDKSLYIKISKEAIKKVKEYNPDAAADEFINACIKTQERV